MKIEEKDLLLKDLCVRLPYGVKGIITYNGDKDIFTIKGIFNILFLSDTECCHIEDFKPYLRSMDSMTEEEEKEFQEIKLSYHFDEDSYILLDWLNKNMFDYRGLIPMGLALEAPKGMYEKGE